MQSDQEKRIEFAELTKEKRTIDARKKDINKRLGELEPQVLDGFERDKIRSINLSGLGTLHLRKEGWVRVVKKGKDATAAEKRRAIEALRSAGFEQYVEEGFNTQSLSAHFREITQDGEQLPAELEGAIRFDTSFKLGLRAG